MTPKIGVGAVIYRKNCGRQFYDVLLVQRAHSPGQGLWALPGGHLDWGESLADGLRREIAEELNISIDIGPLVYVAELHGLDYHFVILDYAAMVRDGEPAVSSDAQDWRWVTASDMESLDLAPGMEDFLTNHDVRRFLHWEE